MTIITFKSVGAAEDAAGSIFSHDGLRCLIDFVPAALEDASNAAIRDGDGLAILPLSKTFEAGSPASTRPAAATSYRIQLKGCVIEGPFGRVGAAVKTAALADEQRLEDWLERLRRTVDV